MAESALAKKIKLKPDQRVTIIDTPEGYTKLLARCLRE